MATFAPARSTVVAAGLVALGACFPLLAGLLPGTQNEFYMQQLTWIMIFGILCVSLDVLVGVAGLVSLGHAAFYGLGAYLIVLLTPAYEAPSLATTLPAAMGVTAVIAALIGAVALRTKGLYFIMVTLAVGQMFYYFANDSHIAGGSDGMYMFARPRLDVFGVNLIDFESKTQFFYATLIALSAEYFLIRLMLSAPFGRVLQGIGINESRTQSLGFNIYLYKLVAYVICAEFAALSGILAATQYGYVNPTMLGWHTSGNALVTVILGGVGTIYGAIFGAFFIEVIRQVLESVTDHWLLPFGFLILVMVSFLPKGLVGFVRLLGLPQFDEAKE